MSEDWKPFDRTRRLADRLVRWESETGSAGEASFAHRLADLLRECAYFRDNPDDIALIPSHGDPKTFNVAAVVRGSGRKTLALGGHFDTVATDNYLELQHLACKPEELAAALIADLESRALAPAEAIALADLKSGAFIPGRGMLDMKSGIAAGIAALEQFSMLENRIGNLVLFATPDEERNSRGMRSLRNALPALAERWGLDIVGGINLDATSDQGDGVDGRAVYLGTIGKLMPFAMVIGQSSHAAYPFEGVSAHRITAEIMRAIEANTDLCDRGAGAVSPPPVCLESRDVRAGYEVTTPDRVWTAFNWLFHSWSAAALFERFNGLVAAAAAGALNDWASEGAGYAKLTGMPAQALSRQLRMLTVGELRGLVNETGGAAARERLASLEQSLVANDNPLAVSRLIVEAMIAEARLAGPAVVTGFASLHYPHCRVDETSAAGRALLAAIDTALERVANRPETRLTRRDYFTGISDMSFFGAAPDAIGLDVVAANTPASAFVDQAPEISLNFPTVNIGPWGREFHQRLERLYAPYAFDTLPRILLEVSREMLVNHQA